MHLTSDRDSTDLSDLAHASARLGIVGGGQLARLTALAALPLGCEVTVLERTGRSPAARLAPRSTVGNWADPAVLQRFAANTDVVTLENEFVPAAVLRQLEQAGHAVYPSAACLELTQDKFIQKQTLAARGLPVPAFRAVASPEDVAAAAGAFGWPLVLKTRRNGYDGRGNFTLRSAADIPAGWQRLRGGDHELLVESFCRFTKELAVIVTRGRDGATVAYPVVETTQRDHICHLVHAPADLPGELAVQASALAVQAVTAVGGVGSFGVELFYTAPGTLAINELAPRVHNSGHYTIEACECSQFENHVRAVLGWPLGRTRMIAPAAAMVNLLGRTESPARPRGLAQALALPGVHVHLYAKATAAPGRKLGHVTALGDTPAEALARAEAAAAAIGFGTPL
ncbi:MAG: 5-(carboxyamino)imidazole ribonucleotide synthase [Verrucomicrobia bacterium]|nr:5-(carboxyamino)imidazole ribonucleotide synthase [Verrucomicrobiota bacterium]